MSTETPSDLFARNRTEFEVLIETVACAFSGREPNEKAPALAVISLRDRHDDTGEAARIFSQTITGDHDYAESLKGLLETALTDETDETGFEITVTLAQEATAASASYIIAGQNDFFELHEEVIKDFIQQVGAELPDDGDCTVLVTFDHDGRERPTSLSGSIDADANIDEQLHDLCKQCLVYEDPAIIDAAVFSITILAGDGPLLRRLMF